MGFASALVPSIFNLHGFLWETLFEAVIPAALMLGLGVPANKLYPAYCQRRLGLVPVSLARRIQPVDAMTGTWRISRAMVRVPLLPGPSAP